MWGYGLVEKALPFTYNNLNSTWLMTSLAVDCSLCSTLLILVRKRFGRTTIRKKGSPVRRLISSTIQSAALTAVLGFAGAVMSCFPQASTQTADVPLAFIIPLPSLYALALVTTLSARGSRRPVLVQGTILNVRDVVSPEHGHEQTNSVSHDGGGEKGWGAGADTGLGIGRGNKYDGDQDRMDDSDSEIDSETDDEYEVRLEPAFAGLQTTRRPTAGDIAMSTTTEGTTIDDFGLHRDERDQQQVRWA